jgi:hypothetical protein
MFLILKFHSWPPATKLRNNFGNILPTICWEMLSGDIKRVCMSDLQFAELV